MPHLPFPSHTQRAACGCMRPEQPQLRLSQQQVVGLRPSLAIVQLGTRDLRRGQLVAQQAHSSCVQELELSESPAITAAGGVDVPLTLLSCGQRRLALCRQ